MIFIREIINDDTVLLQDTENGSTFAQTVKNLRDVKGYENGVCIPCQDLVNEDRAMSAKLSALHGARIECRSGFLVSFSAEDEVVIDMKLEHVRGIAYGANTWTPGWEKLVLIPDDDTVFSILDTVNSPLKVSKMDISNVSLDNCISVLKMCKYRSLLDSDEGRAAYCSCVANRSLYITRVRFTEDWDNAFVKRYGASLVSKVDSCSIEKVLKRDEIREKLDQYLNQWLAYDRSVKRAFGIIYYLSEEKHFQIKGLNKMCMYLGLGGSSSLLTDCANRFVDRLYREIV